VERSHDHKLHNERTVDDSFNLSLLVRCFGVVGVVVDVVAVVVVDVVDVVTDSIALRLAAEVMLGFGVDKMSLSFSLSLSLYHLIKVTLSSNRQGALFNDETDRLDDAVGSALDWLEQSPMLAEGGPQQTNAVSQGSNLNSLVRDCR
jgi:hypothetical protein